MSDDMPRTKSVPDATLLDAIDEMVTRVDGPVVTVSDLAELIDMSHDGIRGRLKDLEQQGLVKSRHVGARATVWWRD